MKQADIPGVSHIQPFDGEGHLWVSNDFVKRLKETRGDDYALDHLRNTLSQTKRIPSAKALDFVEARKTQKVLDDRSVPAAKPDPNQLLMDDEGVGLSGLSLPWKSANKSLPSLTIDLAR